MNGPIAFFVLASAISWALWAPLWLPALGVEGMPAHPAFHHLGAFGPLVAAFVLSSRDGPWSRRALLLRMVWWGERRGWLLVALLGPPLLLALAVLGVWALGGGAPVAAGAGAAGNGASPLPSFLVLLLTFGFGEETGWRGFALPRLQARYTALGATAVLTAGWAAWHLPLFLYRPGFADLGVAGVAGWLASLFTGAVLLTWLFNESRGSVLVAAVFHATIDVVFTSELSTDTTDGVVGFLITLWAVAVLLRTGPRTLSSSAVVAVRDPDPGGPVRG